MRFLTILRLILFTLSIFYLSTSYAADSFSFTVSSNGTCSKEYKLNSSEFDSLIGEIRRRFDGTHDLTINMMEDGETTVPIVLRGSDLYVININNVDLIGTRSGSHVDLTSYPSNDPGGNLTRQRFINSIRNSRIQFIRALFPIDNYPSRLNDTQSGILVAVAFFLAESARFQEVQIDIRRMLDTPGQQYQWGDIRGRLDWARPSNFLIHNPIIISPLQQIVNNFVIPVNVNQENKYAYFSCLHFNK